MKYYFYYLYISKRWKIYFAPPCLKVKYWRSVSLSLEMPNLEDAFTLTKI